MTLTGYPLEDLYAVADYLNGLEPRELWPMATSSPSPPEAWYENVTGVSAAYVVVRRMRLLMTAPELAAGGWESDQEGVRTAEARLRHDWPADSPLAQFREHVDWLLQLDSAAVQALCDGPTPELDRRQVVEELERLLAHVDRLERKVNGRGGWPR